MPPAARSPKCLGSLNSIQMPLHKSTLTEVIGLTRLLAARKQRNDLSTRAQPHGRKLTALSKVCRSCTFTATVPVTSNSARPTLITAD
jgi:hypothetical protein